MINKYTGIVLILLLAGVNISFSFHISNFIHIEFNYEMPEVIKSGLFSHLLNSSD